MIEQRTHWMQALVSMDETRATIVNHIDAIDKVTSAQRKACSFCDRLHSDTEITAVANGLAGVSICNLCVVSAHGQLITCKGLARGRKRAIHRRKMPPRLRAIVDELARVRCVSANALLSSDDKSDHVVAMRDEAMWTLRLQTKVCGKRVTLEEIGSWFGRDASSVSSAVRRHEARGGEMLKCA